MTKTEFQAFAVACAFEQVVIRRLSTCPQSSAGESRLELWGHVEGFRGDERFLTARGQVKTWVDLSTVYAEVRAMGYAGPIVVEG